LSDVRRQRKPAATEAGRSPTVKGAAGRVGRGHGRGSLSAVTQFAAAFLGLVLVLGVLQRIDYVVFNHAATRALVRLAARTVLALLTFVGADATIVDNVIVYRWFRLRIIPECTGVDVIGLFVAAVLAFPAGWSRRLTGLALGIPVLVVLNLIRLVTLIYVGTRFGVGFEYAHLFVWPALLLTATIGIWVHWARIVPS